MLLQPNQTYLRASLKVVVKDYIANLDGHYHKFQICLQSCVNRLNKLKISNLTDELRKRRHCLELLVEFLKLANCLDMTILTVSVQDLSTNANGGITDTNHMLVSPNLILTLQNFVCLYISGLALTLGNSSFMASQNEQTN